jgi:hypothetical protein
MADGVCEGAREDVKLNVSFAFARRQDAAVEVTLRGAAAAPTLCRVPQQARPNLTGSSYK